MVAWTRIAIGAAAVLLLVPLLQVLLTVHPPRHTSTITPARWGLDHEEVRFETRDGLTLAGWFVPAEQPTNETILIGHGYPFDKGDVLPGTLFLRERFNLFYFDHRSFGESEGRITTVGLREVRDVHAAVDELLEREDTRQIGALGFSLSAATILMAEDERIEAIVADSSYADLGTMSEQMYAGFGPLKHPFSWISDAYARIILGAWPSDVSPEDAISRTQAPVLLIHGEDDETIPPDHSQRLHANAPEDRSTLWLVEDAQHGGAHAVAGKVYEERVLAFLERNLDTSDGSR